jgi:hypothetical protein
MPNIAWRGIDQDGTLVIPFLILGPLSCASINPTSSNEIHSLQDHPEYPECAQHLREYPANDSMSP